MDIRDSEKHERVVNVFLTRGQLEAVIENAIAEKTGIPVEILREHGKLKIEANMEGSPEYQSGYKASLKATIPLPTTPVAPNLAQGGETLEARAALAELMGRPIFS